MLVSLPQTRTSKNNESYQNGDHVVLSKFGLQNQQNYIYLFILSKFD